MRGLFAGIFARKTFQAGLSQAYQAIFRDWPDNRTNQPDGPITGGIWPLP